MTGRTDLEGDEYLLRRRDPRFRDRERRRDELAATLASVGRRACASIAAVLLTGWLVPFSVAVIVERCLPSSSKRVRVVPGASRPPRGKGCQAASCRTLKTCLCTCHRCADECSSRKP